MTMQIQPYLFLDGRCEEAIEFYKKVFGAQVGMLMRFKEAPPQAGSEGACIPADGETVMHASVTIGDSRVMMSDGRNTGAPKVEGFALSVNAKDEADAKRMFDALANGGQVTMPLSKTFFSPCFGMVADKLGVHWMIIVEP
jgi:PhnB protein